MDVLVYFELLLLKVSKSWLIGKDSDAGRDWGQEEKGMTEDEMVEWHHQLNGCESEWTPGVGDGQGSLEYCSPWGLKESDTTDRRNWTELKPTGSFECSFLRQAHGVTLGVSWDFTDRPPHSQHPPPAPSSFSGRGGGPMWAESVPAPSNFRVSNFRARNYKWLQDQVVPEALWRCLDPARNCIQILTSVWPVSWL